MLTNVTQMHWREFVLARLQLLILQRTLEIELQCHQLCKTGGVGDISGAEAMASTSLKSQLEVYRKGQYAFEGSPATRCLGRIPFGKDSLVP